MGVVRRLKAEFFVPLTLLAFGVAGCSEKLVEEPEIVRPAKLYVTKAPEEQFDVSFPAIIEAGKSSTLTFQVGGLLQSLPVREGQQVRAGTPIARLEQRRYSNAVASAKAQFDSAQSEYQSALRLLEEDAIARIAVNQRRAQRDVAQSALDSARKDLADTTLRAPFSGVVAEKLASQFETVSAGQDIVKLQTTGTVEAAVSIPSSILQNLAGNQTGNSYVVLSSAPDTQIPGRFRSVTTQGDTQSQTFAVNFAFEPPPGVVVLPGMTGTVFLSRDLVASEVDKNAMSVPLGAILSDGKIRYVWIVDRKTMTVSKRKVEIAKGVGENVSVTKGLKVGETIVAAGAAYLQDGMKIRPSDI